MSLTSFVNEKEVREAIDNIFPKPKLTIESDQYIEPKGDSIIIGTAFDYLFRFWIESELNNVQKTTWISKNGLNKLRDVFGGESSIYENSKEVFDLAKKRYENFLESKEVTNDLIKSTMDLARLDIVFRGDINGFQNMGFYLSYEVKNIKKLYEIIPKDFFKQYKKCILNPNFGEVSLIAGGADADLILDNSLIEVKTIKGQRLKIRDWRQIVGYLILIDVYRNEELKIFENDVIEKNIEIPNIEKIGYYYSRYGKYLEMSSDIIYENENYTEFKKWFIEECINRNQDFLDKDELIEYENTNKPCVNDKKFRKIYRSPSLVKILKILRRDKSTVPIISEKVKVTKARVYRNLKKLEKIGLVKIFQKNISDSNSKYDNTVSEITEEGRKIISRIDDLTYTF